MATQKIDKAIESLDTSWSGYIGKRVEEFLKGQLSGLHGLEESKGSYLYILSTDEATNMVTVGIFASAETCTQYTKDPGNNADLILSSVEIPMGSGGGSTEASYIVKLTNMGEKTITATKKSDLVAKVRFTSQIYDPSDRSKTDSGESATLTVETRMQNASEWKSAGTITIQSVEGDDATAYTEVDLSPYCADGTQSVRMIAVGETSEKNTSYVNITVTLTNIGITFQTSWQKPFEYKAVSPTITIPMLVTGSISKVLHLKVSSEGSTAYSKTYDYNLGTATYTETPYAATIDHPQAHGIYTVEAWITSGDTVKTESTTQSIMCSLSGSTTPLMAINNVGAFQNWSNVKAFDYAVYNPGADSTDITFALTNLETDALLFSETVQGVQNGVTGSLSFNLEVETEDNSNFPASMTFTSDGTTLRNALRVVIDNAENFAPTGGADFYLNPKTRNNSESTPATIINAMTGETVKTTFEGMTFISDGWLTDSNTGARCLRVLAGSKVNINYDAYSDDTPAQGLTIELDFATRNVTDEEGVLLQMGTPSTVDEFLVGLWLKAQESCFMTMGQRDEGSQNWTYSKNTRTHVAVNIVPNLSNQGTNYVRVFINGIISREFVYADSDSFWQAVSGTKKTGGIVIAPEGADIDIYGLRIYKKSLSASDIRQNRLAAFATVEEKKAFKDKNDILGSSGLISYYKAYDKYDTILYKGSIPSLKNPSETYGDVVIHKVGDPAHSGTLSNMKRKGQGSTSKKYWTWNIQSDFKTDEEHADLVQTWIDENGVDHGKCYQNADGLPMAAKLVDKRNWASSMQSHKIGATRLYNDLYKAVVGKNEITSIEGNENCRTAVYEDPFLVFQQETDDSEPVFVGMGTFGSGKADKPTFGYDKTKTPDMMMIEGSDNNPRLTKHQVPWIEGDVTYDESEEGYVYAGTTSWDFDLGNQETLPRFIEIFNFIYAYGNRIKPYNGTLTQLKAASADLDVSYQYWVTKAETGSVRYDLYRYEETSKEWVPAGTSKNEDGTYATLNLKTQLADYLPSTFTNNETYLEWDGVNADLITARKAVFTAKIGDYIETKDIMFMMCMMKLLAACDNRAKNTYLWVFSKEHKLRAFQDDLDSILPTDNQGKLTKPYYVEEHDFDESQNKNYWNGEDNVLYNMMEECFPTELRNVMNEILTAMAKLGGTVMGCFENYFMSVCQYFPAVAYNEWARIGYEYAHFQRENGNYDNDTDPITQSLGSQEEGERQWCSDRAFYMSSYALYGEFNPTSPSGGNINYRSTEQMTVNFDLTLATWLYPVVTIGQSTILSGQRHKAGDKVSVSGMTDSNTQNIVLGVNYMNDIGTWYDKPANGAFAFNGNRIKNLVAGTDTASDIHLKVSSITLGAMTSLQTLDVHNLSTLSGTPDVSKNTRLVSVDARGTSITGITLPSQEFLTTLKLPATMQTLRLDGQRGLTDLTLEGWTNLQTVYINQPTCPGISALDIIAKLKDCTNLANVTVLGVEWEALDVDTLTWLLDNQVKLTGRVTVKEGDSITATMKMRMVGLWGNVDDESNSLYVSYNQVAITRAALSGKVYFDKEGRHSLSLTPTPSTGNDITSVAWAMTANSYATIDPKTGIITVNEVGTEEEAPEATVTATLTLASGKTVESSTTVYFFHRSLHIGDYLFCDGSYYSAVQDNLTPVGVCFYVSGDGTGLFISMRDLGSYVWGLYPGSIPNINSFNEYSYDAYDIAQLPNITSGQMDNSSSDQNMLDDSTWDGFKVWKDGYAQADFGFTEITQRLYDNEIGDYLYRIGLDVGDTISAGQLNTLRIIKHRDSILTDTAVNLPVPGATDSQTEKESLDTCIANIKASKGNDYQQFYYPAASYCHAYKPTVKASETLAEGLGEGCWHLPSAGELNRISFYTRHGSDYADKYAIFSEAKQAALFIMPSSSWYWSSSEYSSNSAWIQNPQSGNLYGNNGKYNGYVVRPVLAFKPQA